MHELRNCYSFSLHVEQNIFINLIFIIFKNDKVLDFL